MMGRKINKYLHSLLNSIRKHAKTVLVYVRKNPRQILRYSKTLLYIATAILVVYWVSYSVNSYWTNSLKTTAAENHAYLAELSGQMQNLPQPNQLQIGATSGNADEIITKHQSVVNTINSHKLSGGSFISLGSSARKISKINNNTASELSEMANQLKVTTDILSVTKKFLQYNPQIDLAPIVSGEETNPTERVNKTAEGIQTTADNLAKLNSPNAKAIKAIAMPLVAQAKSITATNTADWYNSVESAQNRIIILINNDYVKQLSNNRQKLIELYKKYLEIKP